MLFEDAQWADPSSLELLDMLIDRLMELPILLVVSFRAEFAAPWIGRAGASLIALSRLNRRHSEMLAAQETMGPRAQPPTPGTDRHADRWRAAVHRGTDQGGAGNVHRPQCCYFAWSAVPGTLQASLMARLDRLPSARQVAQIGAVIGREFPHALLAAAALLSEVQLTQGLDELIASGLATRRGAPPDAVYTFNHALTLTWPMPVC